MKTQAWGWLMAGVLAAGVNASYHDGGFAWAHHLAGRAEHQVAAVMALASGHADQFLTEARVIAAHENGSCPFSTGLVQAENRVVMSDRDWDGWQAIADREQARADRMEAVQVRLANKLAAEQGRLQMVMDRINVASFDVVKSDLCPRVRVSVPRMPMVNIPAPVIHVGTLGAGPV